MVHTINTDELVQDDQPARNLRIAAHQSYGMNVPIT